MEANITGVLRQDTECMSAVHCLKVPPFAALDPSPHTTSFWRLRGRAAWLPTGL
jgi:hypothetical protein